MGLLGCEFWCAPILAAQFAAQRCWQLREANRGRGERGLQVSDSLSTTNKLRFGRAPIGLVRVVANATNEPRPNGALLQRYASSGARALACPLITSLETRVLQHSLT